MFNTVLAHVILSVMLSVVLTPEGCTLAALLDWVWLKLVQLKQEKDQLC